MTQHPSVQHFVNTTEANLRSVKSFADIALNASERLLALNLDTARALFSNASQNVSPLFGERLDEQIRDRLSVQERTVEQLADYVCGVNEVCSRTQAEINDLNAERINAMSETFQSLLDEASKSAPPGAPDIVGIFETAFGNASKTCEDIFRASREAAESGLTAATDALRTSAATSGRKRAVGKAA